MAILATCWLDERSGLTINRLINKSGDTFAVRSTCNECLNVYGWLEVEPLPSNRSKEFLERCRWNSFDDAVLAIEHYNEQSR